MSKAKDQKFQPDLTNIHNGPLEQRECRDVFCLILFIVNVGAMVYCTIYAYTKGNPSIIYRGTDVDNRICGQGVAEGYPYLYFTNPQGLDSSQRVCVKQCPSYNSGTLSPLMCVTNSNVTSCNYDHIISQNGASKTNELTGTGIHLYGYDSSTAIDRVCIPTSEALGYFDGQTSNKVSSALTSIISGGYLSNFINDIKNNWPILLLGFAIAVVIALLTIVLMRWLTGCVIWVSLIGTLVFMIVLGFMLAYSGNMFGTSNVTFFGHTIPRISDNNTYFKYYGIACWVGAGVFLLLVVCCCNRIRIAVAICKCAGAFVIEVCSAVMVPVVMAIVTVALWAICVTCMIWLVSSAPFVANGDIFTSVSNFGDTSLIRFYYFIFGTLWCNALIQAISAFVVASACCMWYYSHGPSGDLHLPVLRSFGRAFRYHLGSLAFGSIVVALIQFFQFLVQTLKKQVQTTTQASHNKCFQCAFGCAQCCLRCLQCIVKYLNKNAYVIIALKGDNFCSSAKLAFQIIWSNPLRFGVAVGAGSIIMFIGKLMIACGTTGVIYAIINYSTWSKIMSPLLFLLLVFVYSYAVGCIFMIVYELAIDTLMVCFIVDETTQKAKGGKALYAPEQLAQLMDN